MTEQLNMNANKVVIMDAKLIPIRHSMKKQISK